MKISIEIQRSKPKSPEEISKILQARQNRKDRVREWIKNHPSLFTLVWFLFTIFLIASIVTVLYLVNGSIHHFAGTPIAFSFIMLLMVGHRIQKSYGKKN